jgi:ankyrin repeat protein
MNLMNRATALLAAWLALSAPAASAAALDDVGLIDAVKSGNRERVSALLAKRADPNQPEVDGTTALHWAVQRDDRPMAEQLLRAGARVTAANRYGVQPLALACVNANAAMIESLLGAGADANAAMSQGETALMTAARSGVVPAVEALLNHGANVDAAETWRGQTALMWAAAEGYPDVVKTLLAHGANVNARSKIGFTPLLFAARQGHIATALTLLNAGANLNDGLKGEGRTTTAGGAYADPAADAGVNAFLLAAANAHYELAALLLDRGADPNAAPRGWSALHQVSWVRKAGIAGSNDPAPEGSGSMDSLEFVRVLVKHGANLDARVTKKPPVGVTRLNMLGATPFLLAARTADAEYMRLLVELGADPLLSNDDKSTPLMVAAGLGTAAPGEDPGTESEVLEAVKVALEFGGELDAVDSNGETAMHGAATKHVPSVVEFLAARGAKIEVWNRANKDGHTPLKIAEGVERGMNVISSPPTASVIREVMQRAGVPATSRP